MLVLVWYQIFFTGCANAARRLPYPQVRGETQVDRTGRLPGARADVQGEILIEGITVGDE